MSALPIFQALRLADDVVEMDQGNVEITTGTSVWFFRVNIDIDQKGDISFNYDKAAEVIVDNSGEFESLIKEAVDHTAPNWNNIKTKYVGKTPFSINCDKKRFIVLVLHPNRNWQFDHLQSPFKIQSGRNQFYLNPTRVDRQGNKIVGAGKFAGCKLAYFYAKCDEDQAKNGQHNGTFTTQFNIYLDLLLYWNGKELTLPVTVDPDVGHPDGSTPP